MSTRNDRLRLFVSDFQPLERELKHGNSCSVEQMIVELRLTARKVEKIRRVTGYYCHWFAPAYAAMRRHGLLWPRDRSWERWLLRYRARRKAVLAALRVMGKVCPLPQGIAALRLGSKRTTAGRDIRVRRTK